MRSFLLLLLLLGAFVAVDAQEVVPTDSLRLPEEKGLLLPSTAKPYYGGYLLDLGDLHAPVFMARTDSFNVELYDASKDYSALFRPIQDVQYGMVSSLPGTFASKGLYGNTWWGYSWGGLWTDERPWQTASFRLKNGWRLNTYGDYDKDGWRMPVQSSFPWQKNNFRGAFELKSKDGSFGIRVEVRRGHEWPF